ncbi:hypothetical protein [Rubellimicrobium arenae]|uniref:hypothetical protein n=1 Tax=Rubellimicrobium arenae TaxID=2817372 RepID=UPI001B306878|nr:hypothetical protein [Rubellimicrobium arenae]
MRPVPAAALLSVLALAACQTPRESCISNASRELRVIDSLIAETQGNLSRGYAIEQDQEVRVDRDFCHVEFENGEDALVPCQDTDVVNVERPVAIDLGAEQTKLEGLLDRRSRLGREQQAQVRACIAAYPE